MLKKLTLCIMLLCVLFTGKAYAETDTREILIMIGDSRTEGMSYIKDTGGYDIKWCYKSGSGYKHMTETAFPYIDKIIAENPGRKISVICMYGVNDPHNAAKYADAANRKADELKRHNIPFYFVSANPIADEMSDYKYDKDRYVTEFNRKIQEYLADHVIYINTYNRISGHFRQWCIDGVHYKTAGYQEIYNIIADSIRRQDAGKHEAVLLVSTDIRKGE